MRYILIVITYNEVAMAYINKKISQLCDERKWTLYTLSDKTDIPYSTLNSSINRDAPPKFDTLQRICEAFGISLAQFFMEDEQIEILNKEEKELITLFRKLPEKKQQALISLIDK